MTLSVAICGGGALAHTLAGVIGAVRGVRVVVLTRRPEAWSNCIRVHHGPHVVLGAVAPTADPAAVARADLVLVAAPAFAHARIVARIVPHLHPDSWIGALPAIGAFDRLVRALAPRHDRVLGSLRSPYNARVRQYGREVVVSGVVPRLDIVSAAPDRLSEAVRLATDLLGLPTRGLSPFVLATISPAGTIFHPARIFELLGQDDAQDQRFYAGWGAVAARCYLDMDGELATLRRALGCDVAGLDAEAHYGTDEAEILAARIRALTGLPDVATPMRGGALDAGHRFVREDLPFGLAVVRALAGRHAVPTPTIARVHDAIAAASRRIPRPPNSRRIGQEGV